jgi:hypothetical protein
MNAGSSSSSAGRESQAVRAPLRRAERSDGGLTQKQQRRSCKAGFQKCKELEEAKAREAARTDEHK